eukprot:12899021-Prorocentrum_lima.AAC.1
MTELIEAVRQARLPSRTTLRQAAPHSKGTVGPAEAVIRHVGGQIRTLKLSTEELHKTRVQNN